MGVAITHVRLVARSHLVHPSLQCFMVEVVEINDIEELSQYRLLWNSLFPARPEPASFSRSIGWKRAGGTLASDQKLRVLIVYAAGEPLGILPLCVRREKYRLSTVRVLTYPLDNWGTWYGPIGPNPAATMLAAMQHIRRTPRDWDMIELRWVADDATAGGKTARALRVAGHVQREDKSIKHVDRRLAGQLGRVPGRANRNRCGASSAARSATCSRAAGPNTFAIGPPRPAKATATRAGTSTTCANRWPRRVGNRT